MNDEKNRQPDANRDPLTGAPGAHPIGTGLGAIAGGAAGIAGSVAAGAAAGTVIGPVGTVVGAAIGAIVGGLAGKGVAEMVDPTAENTHWKNSFKSRPYVEQGASYDDYGPAYQYGVQSYGKHKGRSFDEAESDLSSGWEDAKGSSSLAWDRAKHATKDAWNKVSDTVERAVPGDSDRDGR